VHFGRFLKKDAASHGMNAEMSSEMGKESCAAAAAEVSLDRQLQAWRNNPSWTDEPPEIKNEDALELPAILEKLAFCMKFQ